jgi:hypothetical protein
MEQISEVKVPVGQDLVYSQDMVINITGKWSLMRSLNYDRIRVFSIFKNCSPSDEN